MKVNMFRQHTFSLGQHLLHLNVFGSEYTFNTINNNNNQLYDCRSTVARFVEGTGMRAKKSGKLNSPQIIINCFVWNNDDDADEQTEATAVFWLWNWNCATTKSNYYYLWNFSLANGKMPSEEYFLTHSRASRARKMKFSPNQKFGIVHSLAGRKYWCITVNESRRKPVKKWQRCKIMKTWMVCTTLERAGLQKHLRCIHQVHGFAV